MTQHFILLLQAPGGFLGSGSINFILFGGMIVVMYFFLYRPQQKKASEQKDFMKQLKKGDRVVTIGGLHGRIIKDNDDTLLIEVDNNVKLKIERSAISLENTKKLADDSAPKKESAVEAKDSAA